MSELDPYKSEVLLYKVAELPKLEGLAWEETKDRLKELYTYFIS